MTSSSFIKGLIFFSKSASPTSYKAGTKTLVIALVKAASKVALELN